MAESCWSFTLFGMSKKTLPLVLAAILSFGAASPAHAADFGTPGWTSVDSFTYSITATTQGNGDLLVEGSWTSAVGANIAEIGSSTSSGQLQRAGVGTRVCDSDAPILPFNGAWPAKCLNTSPAGTVTLSFPVGGSSIEASWLIAASELSALPSTHQCLVMSMGFSDSTGTTLFFATPFISLPNGSGCGSGSSQSNASQAGQPAKYSGPEFSGLSGMGIMTGNTGKLEGKRLNEISAIEIDGKAAPFTVTSATELELSLPEGLTPGLYDLVMNSSAGKLTHISAIQVREPKKSFSITTRSTGKISNDQYIEHSLIASMQIPELNKARCIVNASTQAMAQAMANRLCAVVKASNPNIETTIVEPRTTVKGDAVYARVSYGWN
jgi:hypothetical protein